MSTSKNITVINDLVSLKDAQTIGVPAVFTVGRITSIETNQVEINGRNYEVQLVAVVFDDGSTAILNSTICTLSGAASLGIGKQVMEAFKKAIDDNK